MNRKTSFLVLLAVSIGVGLVAAAPYAALNPSGSRVELNPAFPLFYPFLVAHIFFALVALIAGAAQWIERMRVRHSRLHRTLGRVYVGSVVASGAPGLALALYIDNFTKAVAFLTLSLLWLFTSWKGYIAARNKQFERHRKWMARSYAITLVAVAARVLVPVLILIYAVLHGFTIAGGRAHMIGEILNVNIWVGLVVNLAIVEWANVWNPKNEKTT